MAEARDVEAAMDAPEMAPLMAPESAPLMFGPLHHRLVYHAPNCTTENITITTKQCKTEFIELCEDIEVPVQTVEYQDECMNVTTTLCSPISSIPSEETEKEEEEESSETKVADPSIIEMVVDAAQEAVQNVVEVSEEEEGALKVRREAEPFLLAAPGHPLASPGHPLAAHGHNLGHLHPLPYFVQQHCEEVTKEHCYKKPTFNNSMETKNVCRKDPKVTCEDVEVTVPKTTCIHIPHIPEFIY